ncbi:hypothetical protein [Haloferax sulfurifontis]|uniref:Uncharacterized protein n=2 Tax=Haloferax sulfurifontis TaxID=255616 RepID=M0IIH7_9EURY|nr:hypothetical protein [Haloferax sulfurifontis]ELZ96581.1 hypothetical protein C441_04414 [Haloferax sulfurifontis ATCC BAA-897]GGC72693.1 hypothetical protein GCM10007209_38320 [Haloferax sulfurifontis]
MKRAPLVLAVLLVLTAIVPVGAVAAAPSSTSTPALDSSTTVAQVSDSNNTTTTTGPTVADQARVTAVTFDEDYLRTTREDENSFNATGPYAVFAVSQNVEAARVTQPKAEAKVLDGARTVRVSFAPDAAPPGQRSLYTLELYFEDGSTRSFDLYASQTDQIVASADLREAQDLLDQMRADAEERGYATDVDGLENFYEWQKEQAELFSNLFGPQLEQLFAWFIFTLTTPFAILFIAAVILVAAWRLLKVHGSKLRSLQGGVDLIDQTRQQMLLEYRNQQDAADEERLEDVAEIGPNHVYWQDAFGIQSVKQLADEFAWGRPVTDTEGNIVRDTDAAPLTDDDGEVITWSDGTPVYPAVMEHRGIQDLLEADRVGDTWLEPVTRRDMLGDQSTALAHAKRALMRMTTHHGMPEYRRARSEVRSMMQDLEQARSADGGAATRHRRQRRSGNGAPAGGDD